jgi:hypothetical protein
MDEFKNVRLRAAKFRLSRFASGHLHWAEEVIMVVVRCGWWLLAFSARRCSLLSRMQLTQKGSRGSFASLSALH